MSVEQWWNCDRQEKTEETGEKPIPVPLHPATRLTHFM
jgi:hypothetical protein